MEKQNEESNFFDNLQGIITDPKEIERIKKAQELHYNRIDYLIHKVFQQTEEGRELLEIWTDEALMRPTAEAGIDMVSVGLNEGRKQFIRNIIMTIKKVEKE